MSLQALTLLLLSWAVEENRGLLSPIVPPVAHGDAGTRETRCQGFHCRCLRGRASPGAQLNLGTNARLGRVSSVGLDAKLKRLAAGGRGQHERRCSGTVKVNDTKDLIDMVGYLQKTREPSTLAACLSMDAPRSRLFTPALGQLRLLKPYPRDVGQARVTRTQHRGFKLLDDTTRPRQAYPVVDRWIKRRRNTER